MPVLRRIRTFVETVVRIPDEKQVASPKHMAMHRLESLLLEGLKGKSTIMSTEDWQELRAEVRRRHAMRQADKG